MCIFLNFYLYIYIYDYLPFRDIAIVHKSVSYLTTIDLIEGGNTLDWANDVLITGPIDLGTPFRIRIGFHIRSPADNRTDFGK